ncbi:reverse transcriptase domain-containing protein [Tanacetum coccineum]
MARIAVGEGITRLYLMRRSLEVLRKFHWMILGGRFNQFGLPQEIISDNGKQFRDNPFKDWCEKLNICKRFTSVKHPQTNGLVERKNRSLGEGIKERLDKGSKDWMEEIPHVLWAPHTMIKSSNGDTLFSLTYRMKEVIPAKIGMPTPRTTEIDMVLNNEALKLNLDHLEEKREHAAIREGLAATHRVMVEVSPGSCSRKNRTRWPCRSGVRRANVLGAKKCAEVMSLVEDISAAMGVDEDVGVRCCRACCGVWRLECERVVSRGVSKERVGKSDLLITRISATVLEDVADRGAIFGGGFSKPRRAYSESTLTLYATRELALYVGGVRRQRSRAYSLKCERREPEMMERMLRDQSRRCKEHAVYSVQVPAAILDKYQRVRSRDDEGCGPL